MTDFAELVHEEIVALRNEMREVGSNVAVVDERVANMARVGDERARKISERVAALEKGAGEAKTRLTWVAAWAAAAAVLVPGTLGVVAWLLAKVPPSAWSALGR